MSLAERLAGLVTGYSRIAIVVMLLLTVLVGAGAPMVESSSSLDQFQTESDESEKLDYIQQNFSADDNTTTAQVIVRGDNVLTKQSLLSILDYQQRLEANATVNETLVANESSSSISNVVARTAIVREDAAALERRQSALNDTSQQLRGALTTLLQNPNQSAQVAFDRVQVNTSVEFTEEDAQTFERAATELRQAQTEAERRAAYRTGTRGVLADQIADLEAESDDLRSGPAPTLAQQRDQLESMDESEIEEMVTTLLSADGQNDGVLGLMPSTYDPGSDSASSTMILVTQESTSGSTAQGTAGDRIIDSQLSMRTIGDEAANGVNFTVFGGGVISHEIESSQSDSLTIVGPLALLFVLVALIVAYRDPVDIVLGLFGIGAVLLWTFGLMGWTDINFNQIFVAVPVLLIGLSIDYAIHVFMRHREERLSLSGTAADGRDPDKAGPRGSMNVALAGVGIALLWVTATTVIGFLSNLTSPVPPIQDFGVVSSAGIVAALLIFGILVPALKIEADELLESYGFDRKKRAFGTGGGRFSRVLAIGSTAARKAPYIVILLVLLVSVVGAYGGTQVSTAFEQEDFLADEPPEWMMELPEPFTPGEYTAKSTLSFVNDRFVRQDSNTELLIEGNVTQADTLNRLDSARQNAGEKEVTQTLPNGEPAIDDPLSVMRSVARNNESFNATFRAADTDGDGVPDQNITTVYDELFTVAPDQAGRYIYRSDGEYQAVRMTVAITGGSAGDDVTTQMRDVASGLSGDGLETTATGTAILNKIVQDQLLDTVIESLVISLVAVFLFLMATYRVSDGSATLGAVTLLPVAFSVTWILGTMYLLDIPFNVVTGMITSLTIGLGVAYSIHLSERYTQELERTDSVWDAMETAVTGTGGALLGSAATTVGGFGVLVFAILPPLQQFGIITGLTIIYAFLGSVFVLPSLLVVWTRYVGPEWAAEQIATDGGESAETVPTAAGEDSTGAITNGHSHDAVASRTIEHEHVRPGQAVQVTVTLDEMDGRVGLRETFNGATVSVDSVDPTPASVTDYGKSVYAVWELDDEPAELTYTATIPSDAPDGTTYSFGGVLMTGEDDADVAGEEHATVVVDLFERVVARGSVTDDDLAAAEERLAAGQLTQEQFERIYRTWLGEAATLETPTPEDD
ncbi:efflux RND transporter permease subunit [Salinibaculum rarum]|uniref:efflux RND transporter permease subunit n=1 Tax=Salinibaculum rarum TaxID=3058903 RepID=UPI0026601C05|nr:MMPL family transporter [Salinibaculum sp. KK48]